MAQKDCWFWYWGNNTTLADTCMRKSKLCEGKCKEYVPLFDETAVWKRIRHSLTQLSK